MWCCSLLLVPYHWMVVVVVVLLLLLLRQRNVDHRQCGWRAYSSNKLALQSRSCAQHKQNFA
jgi:hypothetical protein